MLLDEPKIDSVEQYIERIEPNNIESKLLTQYITRPIVPGHHW